MKYMCRRVLKKIIHVQTSDNNNNLILHLSTPQQQFKFRAGHHQVVVGTSPISRAGPHDAVSIDPFVNERNDNLTVPMRAVHGTGRDGVLCRSRCTSLWPAKSLSTPATACGRASASAGFSYRLSSAVPLP
jgi:hypothetical protein